MKELDKFRKFLKEEETVEKPLNEIGDGGASHHIEQIDDDLMYGEFGTVEEVNGYLDAIIAGIEELRVRKINDIEEWESEEEDPFKDEQDRLDYAKEKGIEETEGKYLD